jgi:hypothetical protein
MGKVSFPYLYKEQSCQGSGGKFMTKDQKLRHEKKKAEMDKEKEKQKILAKKRISQGKHEASGIVEK